MTMTNAGTLMEPGMTMAAELIGPADPRWSDMLTMQHDFYHLPQYGLLEASRLGGDVFAAYVEHPGVRLLVPLVSRAVPGSGEVDLVSPYGYPSPLAEFDDVALLNEALRAVVHTLREHGYISLFVRLHPLLEVPSSAFAGLGTVVEHGETVAIALRQSDEEQWREMRQRYRSFLKRSAELGHRAYFDETGAHFDRFIDLYLATMRRQNAAAEYFFTREYLTGLWELLGDRGHLGVVEIDGQIVSAALFAQSEGIVQYHLSGTDDSAVALSPLKTLLNHARQWATLRGAEHLHLGGGLGGSKDSLMQFKAGFSHRRHPFRTWRVVLDDRRYEELSGGDAGSPEGFFPEYRRVRAHAH